MNDDKREVGIKSFLEEVQTQLPIRSISWGISYSRMGVSSLPQSYSEAELACHIGVHTSGVGSVTHCADTGSARVLLRVAHTEESRALVQDYLGPLLEYDRRRSGALLHTLVVYVEQEGNRSSTARQLHLRRQSLDYRLSQIQQLTGRQLRNPQDRFAFALSLQLYQLQHRAAEADGG